MGSIHKGSQQNLHRNLGSLQHFIGIRGFDYRIRESAKVINVKFSVLWYCSGS